MTTMRRPWYVSESWYWFADGTPISMGRKPCRYAFFALRDKGWLGGWMFHGVSCGRGCSLVKRGRPSRGMVAASQNPCQGLNAGWSVGFCRLQGNVWHSFRFKGCHQQWMRCVHTVSSNLLTATGDSHDFQTVF